MPELVPGHTAAASRRAHRSWVLVALSAVVILLVTEVALRAATSPEQFLDPSTDDYWRAWRASSAFASSDEPDTVPDPELGWRMKPNVARGDVHHDERGFRRTVGTDKVELATRSSPGAAASRILTIGDSFTYGLGVADEDTYPAQLARVTGVEVVNAGVNAYGVDQAVAMWEREGRALRPSVVVLGIYVDDVRRLGLSIREGSKPRVVPTEEGGFRWLPPDPSADAGRSAWSPRLLDVAASAWRRVARKLGRVDEAGLSRLEVVDEYLLARLRDAVAESRARLLVVFIGHVYDGQPDHAWIEASVTRSCRKLGIECLNLAEARRRGGASDWYGENGHFSAAGNRAAADAIGRALGLVH